jgi:endonuclease III
LLSKIDELKRSLLYSEELGIDLKKNSDEELFKWFLASILFGARITESIAKNTYRAFERYNLLEPQKILDAGWDFLVNPIMREGGYVRYDFKTSTKILKICETLIREYDGSLKKLHEVSRDAKDLEKRILNFYGIGLVTMNIFLRELRPYWRKADPEPLPIVRKIDQDLGISLDEYNRKSITFSRIEAGLIRLRRG